MRKEVTESSSQDLERDRKHLVLRELVKDVLHLPAVRGAAEPARASGDCGDTVSRPSKAEGKITCPIGDSPREKQ